MEESKRRWQGLPLLLRLVNYLCFEVIQRHLQFFLRYVTDQRQPLMADLAIDIFNKLKKICQLCNGLKLQANLFHDIVQN